MAHDLLRRDPDGVLRSSEHNPDDQVALHGGEGSGVKGHTTARNPSPGSIASPGQAPDEKNRRESKAKFHDETADDHGNEAASQPADSDYSIKHTNAQKAHKLAAKKYREGAPDADVHSDRAQVASKVAYKAGGERGTRY